jgi:hypothetical protein
VVLEGDRLEIDLPAGWEGRFLRPSAQLRAIQAADAPLDPEDDELGEHTTAALPAGASYLSLTEYLEGSGVTPGRGAFRQRGIDLPLDPTQFSAQRVAHFRPGLLATQQSFSLAGRAFSLYVVIAGERPERRHQLLKVDYVLRTLRVSEKASTPPEPGRSPSPGPRRSPRRS